MKKKRVIVKRKKAIGPKLERILNSLAADAIVHRAAHQLMDHVFIHALIPQGKGHKECCFCYPENCPWKNV